MKKAFIIVFVILFFDQFLKIWIKTHMHLGEEISIFGNWFIIHFTENEGMAFGMKLGGNWGKLILSIFRICAVILMIWWLYKITRKKVSNGVIISIAMVIAGAMGNILDSAFYGLIFNESTYMQVASFMPAEGGYTGFLYGKVVDMLYFPVINTRFPAWFPFFGGEEFEFFRPVFNIADSSITIGVLMLILFQKKFFRKEENVIPPQELSSR
ncbi:MAG TPA: lipoprotein signal peptidase [Bacteroidales bacterium]|nr:lipoprotein signal peptidase [Bacteroidales bacterium]